MKKSFLPFCILALLGLSTCNNSTQGLSKLVTGNGYGFAVYSPQDGQIVKFYAHPYRFEKAKPNLTVDGVLTPNLISGARWESRDQHEAVKGSLQELTSVGYIDESHVIRATSDQGEEVFYMPFGLEQNALVTAWSPMTSSKSAPSACLNIDWASAISSEENENFDGRFVRILHFRGVQPVVVVAALAPGKFDFEGCLSGETPWAFLSVENPSQIAAAVGALERWKGSLSEEDLLKRELREFEAWRKPPTVHFQTVSERALWRQSETVLRMAQIREKNNDARHADGLILGSLPEGPWFIPWVRDMNYSLMALIRTGHFLEAKRGLEALLKARPVGKWTSETNGYDYQISVTRYFGNGEEESDYSGMHSPNIEFDGWGLTLASAAEYLQATKDSDWLKKPMYRGTVYETLKNFVVRPLIGNIETFQGAKVVRADASIWEVHQENKKHFAYTDAAAIHGLLRFRELALVANDAAMVQELDRLLPELQSGFTTLFIENGVLVGTAESLTANRMDGAVFEALNWGLVKDSRVYRNTLEMGESLKTVAGGYKRSMGQGSYDAQEWIFVDFALAQALAHAGSRDRSASMIQRLVEKIAGDNGLIPELYVARPSQGYIGKIGDPSGAIPMVSYGAGMYISYLLDRESLLSSGSSE